MALRTVSEARLGLVDLTIAPAYDDSTAEMALRSLAAEHHLDIDTLIDAAATGELRSLLDRSVEDEGSDGAHGRETTVRRHMTHLLV